MIYASKTKKVGAMISVVSKTSGETNWNNDSNLQNNTIQWLYFRAMERQWTSKFDFFIIVISGGVTNFLALWCILISEYFIWIDHVFYCVAFAK